MLLALFMGAYGANNITKEIVHDCETMGKFLLDGQVFECKPLRKPLAAESEPAKAEFMKQKEASQSQPKEKAPPPAPASAADQIPR